MPYTVYTKFNIQNCQKLQYKVRTKLYQLSQGYYPLQELAGVL